MNKQTKTIATFLLVLMAAMISACGNKGDNGSTESASLTPPTTTITSSNGTVYASCGQASATNMTVNIESYIDSTTGRRDDLMRLKVVNLDPNFATNGNYLEMWRWKADSSGATSIDSTPLQFRVESISDGSLMTGWVQALHWSDLSSLAASLGVSTVADLFARVTITVDTRDTALEYDVIKVVSYNSSNAVSTQVDLLMPLFALQPTDYAATHPSILQNLHPLKNMSGYSTPDLTSAIAGYCF
jgi:hypothetical protein